jgi:hypothetical protein
MSSFHPVLAVVRVCLSSTDGDFAETVTGKASRLQSALVGRSIFAGAELQTGAPWHAATGTLIAIGEESEVRSALRGDLQEPPAVITMFEEYGTRCIVELGDTRRVGLIIEKSETADALVIRQGSQRLTELRARLARGGQEWASTYYTSLSESNHEATTEMVLKGFPPGRERAWQTTLRTEIALLRFMLDVAELSWLDQAADAAQAGVIAFRAQAENRVGGRDAAADRAAIRALDYQMNLKHRLLAESGSWLTPFREAATSVATAQDRAALAGAEALMRHLLDREAQCLECRGILALGGPGAAEAAPFEVPPLVSLHTGAEGHGRFLLASHLLKSAKQPAQS